MAWQSELFKHVKLKIVGNSLDTKLRVLLNYHTTPQGTTGVPPCRLMMGRQIKTCLDLVLPDVTKQACSDESETMS